MFSVLLYSFSNLLCIMRSVTKYIWGERESPKLNKVIPVYRGWTKKGFVVFHALFPLKLIYSLCFTVNMVRMRECMYMHIVASRSSSSKFIRDLLSCKGIK